MAFTWHSAGTLLGNDNPGKNHEQHAFLDAAKNYEFEKVKSLAKSNRWLINVQPDGRWSALHQAAAAGDESMIKWLIARGARLELSLIHI